MSYLGENVVIKGPSEIVDGDSCTMITDEKVREAFATIVCEDARKNHQIVSEKDGCWNSIKNDDYLFIKDIIYSIQRIHRNTFFDSATHQWIKGNRELPYIEVIICDGSIKELGANYITKYNEFGWPVIKDKSLVCNATEENSRYTLRVDQYWFPEYIRFLRNIFDENEELTISSATFIQNISLKKSIYLTAGFEKWFDERALLVGTLFYYSIWVILGHEMAHVARRHTTVNKRDNAFYEEHAPLFELDADLYASRWLIDESFFTEEAPTSLMLPYFESDFVDELSLKLFAMYLACTWMDIGESRSWSRYAIWKGISSQATHPPYQLRAFNIFNQSIQYLHNWTGNKVFFVGDKHSLTTETVAAIYHNTASMVQSFESAVNFSLNGKRTTEEKLHDQIDQNDLFEMFSTKNDMFFDSNRKAVYEEMQPYYDQMYLLTQKLNNYNLYRR